MRKFTHIFLLSIIFVFHSVALLIAQQTYFISGKVMTENGTPLNGVSVTIDNARPVTSSTIGVFGVDLENPKPKDVKVVKKGYILKDWEFDTKLNKIKIVMRPLSKIKGKLQDENEQPISGARVTLSRINSEKPALTNNNGEFDIAVPENADINEPGDIFVNNKQIPAANLASDGKGGISIKVDKSQITENTEPNPVVNALIMDKAKVFEERKITKIKVTDQAGNMVDKLKISVNGQEYITTKDGEITTKEELHKNTKLFIEGFKIKLLPNDFYLLVSIEPLSSDEEVDTTGKQIDDIIVETATIDGIDSYEEKFNRLLQDLEGQKRLLLQFNEQTRLEITEINKRLIEDKSLTPAQRKDLEQKRNLLEEKLIQNELDYQEALNQTKVALDSMKVTLINAQIEKRKTVEELARDKERARLNMIIFVVIAISLVIVVAVFFITNRRVRKEHEQLEETSEQLAATLGQVIVAKNEIEQKNNQITTSIRYAETMQKAILPLSDTFDKHFSEHAIIYIPKDIVSGDFYWCLPTENATFIALVDCTGHGVPGAFMSLIGNNSLNEAVNQKNIQDPAAILEELNVSIRKALRQESTDNDDGMDVALCRISKTPNKNGKFTVTFAGAKRNMLYYSKLHSKELLEIKGDKRTIGGFFRENKVKSFTDHEIELQKGDAIYMFTDGLADQTNPQGEKFGSVRLKALLKENLNTSLSNQQRVILEELNLHQHQEAQRDDITLLGIKI